MEKVLLWFELVVAFMYGTIIGSFLNVCIYRLPPRIYYFEDLLYKSKVGEIFLDVFLWFKNLFKKEEAEPLEPFLYAECMWSMPLHPETVAIAGIVHSFNLYKYHFPDDVTIVKPRSFCPHCGKTIKWWMNIPLLSYIFLGGKCYYCKAEISPRYFINELISGFLCASLFYVYGRDNMVVFLYYYLLASLCLVVFYIDLDHWLILDEITIPFSLVGILGSLFIPREFFSPIDGIIGESLFKVVLPSWGYNFIVSIQKSLPSWIHLESFIHSLLGAFLGFVGLYSIAVIGTVLAGREAMGGGDIKFAMLMGAFLGIQKSVLAFFASTIIGTLVILPFLLIGKKTGKDQIPFGCFLTIGTVLVIYVGNYVFNFYFGL